MYISPGTWGSEFRKHDELRDIMQGETDRWPQEEL